MGAGPLGCIIFPAPGRSCVNKQKLPERLYEALSNYPGFQMLHTHRGIGFPTAHIRYDKPDRTPFTIIYSHGNAEDLGIIFTLCQELSSTLKSNVFAYEYPGYGSAGGSASEGGCYDAAEETYQYVTKELKVPPYHVILFGRSLGSGPTVELARRHPEVSGVVLQSPLTSAIRTKCCECVAWTCCCIDMFKSINKARSILCPVFIMHGIADEVVPCSNGRSLHDAFPGSREPLWIEDAGHNDMEQLAGHRMMNSMQEFLVTCESNSRNAEYAQQTSGGPDAGYKGEALPLF